MAGVIDKDGQQWERCTAHPTRGYVKFPQLAFDLKPEPAHPRGGTICVECVLRLRAAGTPLENITPYHPENWDVAEVPVPLEFVNGAWKEVGA